MGPGGHLAIPSGTPSKQAWNASLDLTMIRPVLDFFIFLSQHMVLAFLLLSTMSLIFLPQLSGKKFSYTSLSRKAHPLLLVLSALALVLFGGVGIWYLTLDSFAGEVEPLVSSLSWLVQSGHPLYHEVDAAERYSVLYGPSVFLTNGLFLKFLGPSLAVAKLGSLLAAWAGLIFLYASIARKRWDSLALVMCAVAVLYFWLQGFSVHLVRPDAYLMFAVGLGLFAAVKLRRLLAVLTMAVALGFAVNLKIHAFLYFLPLLALLADRHGFKAMFNACVLSAVVILAPFLLHPQVSLPNYISWLKNATGHGLEFSSLVSSFRFGFFLILPVLLLGTRGGNVETLKRWRSFLFSLLVGLGGVLILAAKPGAGLVHLLPLIPVCVYATAMMVLDGKPNGSMAGFRSFYGGRIWAQGSLVAMFMVVIMGASVCQFRAVSYVNYLNGDSTQVRGDLQGIMDRYPNMSMGMACGGEDSSFQHTWVSPLLVFADNPLMFEPIALMDCQLSGKGLSPKTFRAMADGQVALWLVPKEEKPFSKNNWYAPYDPIFSQSFVSHFMDNYTCKEHSEFFDLWFWNGSDDRVLALQPAG
jgi:hypothetical protein